MAIAAAVTIAAVLAVMSLGVVARAWSTACCDPGGFSRGMDGGDLTTWLDNHGDR